MNAAHHLLSAGAEDAVALVCGDERLTYGQLRARVRRAAGAWRELGVQTGDRVVVMGPDGLEWVIGYLGAIWAGGVAVGLNPRLEPDVLTAVLRGCEPRLLWTGPDQAAAVADQAAALPTPAPVVTTGTVPGCLDWTDLVALAREVDPTPREDEDPALWIHTSGTTGTPKAVVHAQRSAIHAATFADRVLGVGPADRLQATSKLFFAYTLGNSLFAGLGLGASVVLDPRWPTPDLVADTVARHAPTVLFSVPTLYSRMLRAGVATRLAGSAVRHFVSAGEALPEPVSSAWTEATGSRPISGYGTSETLCLMLYGDTPDGLLRATPRTEVREPESPDPDTPGRIRLRGPTLGLGYRTPSPTQDGGFADGWFTPGDLFLHRGVDRLEFAGRNDDLLKISGQWVSTQWIEQALAAACGETVSQVAAVGTTTPEGLSAIAVLAVPAPGRSDEARHRMSEATEDLHHHCRPTWVHWVDELPLTATGKLARSRVRAMHDQRVPAGPTPQQSGGPR